MKRVRKQGRLLPEYEQAYRRAEVRMADAAPKLLDALRSILYAWDYGADDLEKALRLEIDDARALLLRLGEVGKGDSNAAIPSPHLSCGDQRQLQNGQPT